MDLRNFFLKNQRLLNKKKTHGELVEMIKQKISKNLNKVKILSVKKKTSKSKSYHKKDVIVIDPKTKIKQQHHKSKSSRSKSRNKPHKRKLDHSNSHNIGVSNSKKLLSFI